MEKDNHNPLQKKIVALSHLVFSHGHPKRQKRAIFDNFLTQKFNILHFKKCIKIVFYSKKHPTLHKTT